MWSLILISSAATLLSLVHCQSNVMYAKNLPRIGRRDYGGGPNSFIWKSTIPSPAFERRDVRGYAGDEYFLKAAKSVPRIGRRNDDGFLKAGKSIPRIGRRNEEFLQDELSSSTGEGKRSLDADMDLGYYGGAGFSNDDHFVFKRKQAGPSPLNGLF